eukprot:NODE_6276_length_1686_cov_5.770366.p1 GENE.NODE_6276_length_1686_cov_5.770366~~NODE_6276_length_1686_cov_5.770366.p1  ORF type:complete len:406 (+),score=143.64 NODE_6276_length_1686_cov_5.770366:148-1365(+)
MQAAAAQPGTGMQRPRSRSPRKPQEGAVAAEAQAGKQHVSHADVPHFPVVPGQLLGLERRYVVRRLLDDGTFGRVLSCADTVKREVVAVKVVKAVRRYCELAEAEAEVLREIARCDPGRQSHCVQIRDVFLQSSLHYCLVFERLGVNLHDFMLKDCTHGLLAGDVYNLTRQLLQCLSFLHGLGITHTDLRCRNVMFRDPHFELAPLPRGPAGTQARRPRNGEIVVVDFGGALFAQERGDGRIGMRHYRAPEVVLGLVWNEKVDLWAAGCISALAYFGARPFAADSDFEQLALMECVVAAELPRPMARKARSRGRLPAGVMIANNGRLDWPPDVAAMDTAEAVAAVVDAKARVERTRPLREAIRTQHAPLLELLEGVLRLDPARRLSAEAASALSIIVDEDAMVPE